jgi:hypothetical protein
MICPHPAVLNSAAMRAPTPQPHHKRQSRAAGSCNAPIPAGQRRVPVSRNPPFGEQPLFDVSWPLANEPVLSCSWRKRGFSGPAVADSPFPDEQMTADQSIRSRTANCFV